MTSKSSQSTASSENLNNLPLIQPGKSQGLIDAFKNHYLLSLLVKKEMRARYRGSFLGMIWTYFKPAVQFVIYYVFFGLVMGASKRGDVGGNFAVYMFAGLCIVNLFNEILRNCTFSIRQNRDLIKKIYLPRELFPLSAYRVALNHFLPQVVILLIACVATGWHPTLLNLLAIVFALAIISLLAIGLGLIFAALNVFFQDAENFVEMLGMIVTWAAPVLYKYTLVTPFLQNSPILLQLYYVSPLTTAPELFHYAFISFWATPESGFVIPNLWVHSLCSLFLCVIICIIGQFAFHKAEGKFAQKL